MARTATIDRSTRETLVHLTLDLDGTGTATVSTGIGFLDHMLTLLAGHALFDLIVEARGDSHVDDHHTVEDVGICLGLALAQAVGNKAGLSRYGWAIVPMDEALVTTAIDLGGRPAFAWNVAMTAEKIGSFDSQLVEEFWRAATSNARMNFHVLLHSGRNAHHIAEAIFKSAARALRLAVAVDARQAGSIPSTKGTL